MRYFNLLVLRFTRRKQLRTKIRNVELQLFLADERIKELETETEYLKMQLQKFKR